jgi:hypothetical protein
MILSCVLGRTLSLFHKLVWTVCILDMVVSYLRKAVLMLSEMARLFLLRCYHISSRPYVRISVILVLKDFIAMLSDIRLRFLISCMAVTAANCTVFYVLHVRETKIYKELTILS